MSFVHQQTIGLSQVDQAGLLFFSRLFEMCHAAFEAFLAEHGQPMTAAGMRSSAWTLPIVHAEADYRAPLRLGDPVTVAVQVESTGQSSITFGFRITGPDQQLAAVARHVHVAIDAATFRSRPLPDQFLNLGVPS